MQTFVRCPLLLYVAIAGVFVVVVFLPKPSLAISNPCTGANTQCLPYVIPVCGCGQKIGKNGCESDPSNKFQCTCIDNTNGHTSVGKCVATCVCHADSGDGQGVDSGLSQLGKILGDLLSKLKGGGGGGEGGQPPPPPQTPFGSQGCTQFFQTSDITQLSNPCAQYIAPDAGSILGGTGTSSTDCDALSLALGTCTPGGSGGSGAGGDVGGGGGETSTSSTSTKPAGKVLYPVLPTVGGNVFLAGPGATGDIRILTGGATIIAGLRQEGSNTEVAGFFGSNFVQPQSIVARWCLDRPWAHNFLSSIVPPDFFDSLCKWRGYQVGYEGGSGAPVVETARRAQRSATTTPATTTPPVEPKAEIWAVPPKVPLGGRTSIFWRAQGVASCTEISADGNFNQSSLSGGAATVALTGATTFTISCAAADGTTVTKSVTVGLKI